MYYRREIDGLRALAIMPVIFFHAGFEAFSGGFVGVDVFFVISGYLITSIVLGQLEQGKFCVVNFYERRARRILPALFLVMLVSIPFAWFWLLPSGMKDFSQSLVAVSLFASNILFWRESGYFDTAAELKPLLHTWSLAVEEQFYVLFPLFLMSFWKIGKRWILVALFFVFVISFTISVWSVHANPVAAFFLLYSRAWELLAGSFAAFYLSKANRKEFSKTYGEVGGLLGILLICYAVFAFNKTTPFPGTYALFPTLGAVLVVLYASQQTTVGKFLGNRLFVGVGLISYSAYLWHQPIFAFARQIYPAEPSRSVFIVLTILVMFLAYISWKFVETPFRSKLKFNRSKIFTLAVILSFSFILFGLYGHRENGFMSRIDSGIMRNAPDMTLFEDQVRTCWQKIESFPNISSSCVLGDIKGPVIFGLVGDSHAGSLIHVLNKEAINNGFQGRNYSFRSCPPLSTAKPVVNDSSALTCYEFRDDFFKNLKNRSFVIPDVLIVSARWSLLMEKERFNNGEGGLESGSPWLWDIPLSGNNYSDAMRSEIVESIQLMLNAGKKVILIYPVPEMGWNVSRVVSRYLMHNESVLEGLGSVSYSSFLQRSESAYKVLDSIKGDTNLIRIRPERILCNTYVKDRCVSHINGETLYFDDNHLSNKGAELVLREVLLKLSKLKL